MTPRPEPDEVTAQVIALAAHCTPEQISRLILYDLPHLQRRLTAERPKSNDPKECCRD